MISIAYHEGGPPAAVVDLLADSVPRLVVRSLMQGPVINAENSDRFVHPAFVLSPMRLTIPRELLDGLAARGFKFYRGEHGASIYWTGLVRKGTYYIGIMLNGHGHSRFTDVFNL